MMCAVGSKVGKVVAATMVVAAHTLGFSPSATHNFAESCTYVPVSEGNNAQHYLAEIALGDSFSDDDLDDSNAAFPACVWRDGKSR